MTKKDKNGKRKYSVVVEDRSLSNDRTEFFNDLEEAWQYILKDVNKTYGYDFSNPFSRDEMSYKPYRFLKLLEMPVSYTIEKGNW